MRNYDTDMFHDDTAHDLERRFGLLAAVALAIAALYLILYHAV